MGERKIRVLVAKPGLDGARSRSKGSGALIAGRWHGSDLHWFASDSGNDHGSSLTEDVDAVGLSILSGRTWPLCLASLTCSEPMVRKNVKVFVGGDYSG